MITDKPIWLCGSKGRPHLPVKAWAKPEIIVEPQELELYKAQNPGFSFHVLPESDRGFSYMMNAMIRICLARGYRYFVFTDDDVLGLKARESVADKFTRVKHETAQEAVQKEFEFMKAQGLSQLAISFSGQSWSATKPYVEPSGSWGVYICDAVAAQAVGGFDEKLILFADWDMSARLLQAGCRVARTNLVTFEHKMRGMAGGAEGLYAQKERVKASAERVAAKYGPGARVVFVEKHDQFEVRFNWKALLGR